MSKHLTLTKVINHLELDTDQIKKLSEHYLKSNSKYSKELIVYFNLLTRYIDGKISLDKLFTTNIYKDKIKIRSLYVYLIFSLGINYKHCYNNKK